MAQGITMSSEIVTLWRVVDVPVDIDRAKESLCRQTIRVTRVVGSETPHLFGEGPFSHGRLYSFGSYLIDLDPSLDCQLSFVRHLSRFIWHFYCESPDC